MSEMSSGSIRDLITTLSRKVRIIDRAQVERGWHWDERTARRLLKELVTLKMLERIFVIAGRDLQLEGPLQRWSPGEPAPNFGALAYHVQRRWFGAPRRMTAYLATKKAAHYFGGFGGSLKRPLQARHDLHVTSIYLYLRDHRPADAEAWISEDSIAPFRRRQKLPDAMLSYADGRAPVVIEFAGSYRAERIRSMHEDCRRRGLSYELW